MALACSMTGVSDSFDRDVDIFLDILEAQFVHVRIFHLHFLIKHSALRHCLFMVPIEDLMLCV